MILFRQCCYCPFKKVEKETFGLSRKETPKEDGMRRSDIIFAAFAATLFCVAAQDEGSGAQGESSGAEECEEAWDYVEFLKSEIKYV